MEVKSIDTNKYKKELKECTKSVREYVRSLESVYELNRRNLNLAISKLKHSQPEHREGFEGSLITGDFEDNTMVFEIKGEMILKAGDYLITPKTK